MHNRGIVLGAFVALAAAIALAGCSSPATTSDGDSEAAAGSEVAQEAVLTPAAPTVGQCWQISYVEFLQEPDVAGGKQVPCSTAHQAYTIGVESLPTGMQRASASADAGASCNADYNSLLPNNSDAYRILLSDTLPSVTGWASGERWVRCDIQETAVGSPYLSPTFADLPTEISTLVTSYDSSPASYAMCVNEPGTNGETGPKLGSGAVIADCSSAQWRLEPSPNFPQAAGVSYPGYAGLEPIMHPLCGALYDTTTERARVFYPSEQEWDSGSRDFECWVGAR
jgi:hypothetical protein